jgi:hypothetical protein
MVMVFGEITTKAKVNYEEIVRKTCKGIGFTSEDVGLDADTCKVGGGLGRVGGWEGWARGEVDCLWLSGSVCSRLRGDGLVCHWGFGTTGHRLVG